MLGASLVNDLKNQFNIYATGNYTIGVLPDNIDGDYSPKSSINIWPKDLGIVLDIAKSANFSAPITSAALQQFIAASGSGLGHEDDAAVAKVYARNAGIELPKNS